jgi:hypothetical protein
MPVVIFAGGDGGELAVRLVGFLICKKMGKGVCLYYISSSDILYRLG